MKNLCETTLVLCSLQSFFRCFSCTCCLSMCLCLVVYWIVVVEIERSDVLKISSCTEIKQKRQVMISILFNVSLRNVLTVRVHELAALFSSATQIQYIKIRKRHCLVLEYYGLKEIKVCYFNALCSFVLFFKKWF